ncbi:MAG: tetratricopeptide repeat protein [Candidatus Krumholzibacteriota bacterium]|nr:tetratricopeptide repeat protein [Candidatus Krumholzibacteriota bacterium]
MAVDTGDGIVNLERLRREKKNSISCCMIARDEQEFIGAAIDSVKGLVDEVIVVDTGSRDGTALIAAERGARIFHSKWNHSFSEARNDSLARAGGEWILILDADEIIPREYHDRVRQVIRAHPEGAFLFPQWTYTDDSDTFGWSPVGDDNKFNRGKLGYFAARQIRLFPRRDDIRYRGEVHENPEQSILMAGLKLYSLEDVIVHHYGRMKESDRLERKYQHYLALGESKLDADPTDEQSLFELSSQLLTVDRADLALTYIEKGLEIAPGSWKFLNLRGLGQLARGDKLAAESSFRQALEGEGEIPDLYNNLAVALIENHRPREALPHLKKGLELNRHNPNLLRNMASAHVELGEAEKARSYIEKSLELDPFMSQSHVILAEILYHQKDYQGAARSLSGIRFIRGTKLNVYLKTIDLFTRMKLTDQALEIVERAIQDYPFQEELVILSAKVQELRGDYSAAAGIYRRVLSENPNSWEALNSLGCICEKQGQWESALRYFQSALRLSPWNFQIEVNLGIVLGRLNRDEEAQYHFQAVLEKERNHVSALNAWGCFLSKRGRYSEAIEHFTRAIETDARQLDPYLNLGLVCEKLNFPGKAAEIYEKAALLHPSSRRLIEERLRNLRDRISS